MNWRCLFGHKRLVTFHDVCYGVIDAKVTCERCDYKAFRTIRSEFWYWQVKIADGFATNKKIPFI